SGSTITKLLQFEAFDAARAYTATEMMNDLKKGIWSELTTRKPIDIYRRNLQKSYTEKLINLMKPAKPSDTPNPFAAPSGLSRTNDAMSIVKGHAKALAADIKAALPSVNDTATKLHLQDVLERLNEALDPKS
ncbi:MAG TPA: hypothetical protein VEB42_05835, partial [Chitinophagaceae bacterium]|nr:hypothetical protein [Chitinophagaceae bacterium]